MNPTKIIINEGVSNEVSNLIEGSRKLDAKTMRSQITAGHGLQID